MVLNEKKKFPLENVKISRVVLISGVLTFMYFIEFCIGIRTVYYTFKVWTDPSKDPKHLSWILCIGCLFVAVVSTFAVNVLSALWEQKQLEEREKPRSSIRFTFHIIVGCMVWRYISLWCIDSKQCQKKGALLLTMTKFFFTQTFTIPMIIVHVSILESFDELIYDICSILCISVNLILTCTVFDWCYNEVEELKKWDYETVDLVPLIFQWGPRVTAEQVKISSNSISEKVAKQGKQKESNEKGFEEKIIKFLVLLQSFSFSFGRLLALGILLKLAGIYAVSIMFLQLLISVIYLKFQVPILVSETLPKWRQLSRLAFMSYILIFEWHLNRDPKTAYDFSPNMKHSITYYCLATIESVFYLVTWAITSSYAAKSELGDVASEQNRFCRIILITGSLALVFSLTIHIVLLFWRSRRISTFVYSIRRRYETAKLRLSKDGCGKEKRIERTGKLSKSDISDPIPIPDTDTETNNDGKELSKKNSYRDLREPLDDEIEIYFRKCENKSKEDIADTNADNTRKISMPTEDNEFSHESVVIKTIDQLLHNELNNYQSNSPENSEKASNSTNMSSTETGTSLEINNDKEEEAQSQEKAVKSKKTSLSGSITEQWGKMSSASRKFAGSMKDQIQKRKEQLQNFRGSSSPKKKENESATETSPSSPTNGETLNSGNQSLNEDAEISEGYFVGDSRCYQEESLKSVHSIDEKRIKFLDEILSQGNSEKDEEETEMNHKEDSPCSCYICKALGDGRFRRRRSSSVPPADRKMRQEDVESGTNQTLSRYMSSPNISQNRCESKRFHFSQREKNSAPLDPPPLKLTNTVLNLSALSLENRIEHYV